MKKYMTIVALLAAGTAFANAADLTIEALYNPSSTKANAMNKAGATGFNFSMSSSSLASGLTGEYALDELIIAGMNDGTLLSATDSVLFYKKDGDLLTYEGVGTVNVTTDYVIYGTDYATYPGHKYTMNNGRTARVTGDDIRFDVNATYSVFFVTKSSFETNQEIFETADAVTDFVSHLVTRRLTMGYDPEFPDENLQATALNENGAEVVPAYSPYIALTATAVPEPSAFGLLAGMGALALVASRRRRK